MKASWNIGELQFNRFGHLQQKIDKKNKLREKEGYGNSYICKICCPRCGEKDLNIIGDRDIGGAVASGMGVSVFAGTKAGVLAGASGLQQKIYWICKNVEENLEIR